jgi:hypothetical protein
MKSKIPIFYSDLDAYEGDKDRMNGDTSFYFFLEDDETVEVRIVDYNSNNIKSRLESLGFEVKEKEHLRIPTVIRDD